MKKSLSILLVFVMLLSLCACATEPQQPDTNPTEALCAAGHTWVDATCTTPKTCSVCAQTEGMANGHDWKVGRCRVCRAQDSSYNPIVGATWVSVESNRWEVLVFQPDGTCDVVRFIGRPIPGETLEACVEAGVTRLKQLEGDKWESIAEEKYHVFKMEDYYYVGEMTSMTDGYEIDGRIITIGSIPPKITVTIEGENQLLNNYTEKTYFTVTYKYIGNLLKLHKENP